MILCIRLRNPHHRSKCGSQESGRKPRKKNNTYIYIYIRSQDGSLAKKKKIKEFVEYAKNTGVVELKYENGDEKISVKLADTNPVVVQSTQSFTPQGIAPQTTVSDTPKSTQASGLKEITSPFVGTFYRSSSPDTDPYVKPGDRVTKGQALCIVEAMKIMNEIESEIEGEIVEICAENETYVEFGQVLFKVKP